MKKKIIAMITIMPMVLSLCACKKEIPKEKEAFSGSGATSIEEMVPEEGANLVFWTSDKGYGEAIAKAFKEKYGVSVTVEEQGYGSVDKISLSGPAGEGADVYMSPHDSLQQGIASGVFMELEEAVVDYVKEKVSTTGVSTAMSDGKLYGVPVSMEVNCLFYNKQLVDKPATTLEAILEEAKTYNEPEKNKIELLCPLGDGYNEFPFITAEGFSLFGKDGRDEDNPGFDTDEYEKGLELLQELHDVIPIDSADLADKSSLKNAFIEGKVPYYITGPWDVSQFKEEGMEFGVTTLPTYKGQQLTPFAGVNFANVSPYTKYPIAAQLLATFLISEEGAKILYDEYDGITTLQDISTIEEIGEDEIINAFVEQFKSGIPMPSVKRVSYYWSISQDIHKAVFDGTLSPSEGRKKAVENWNSFIVLE